VIEDKGLILKILEGEQEAYAGLVRRHETALFQLAMALLGDRHEAEEAVQEAFIKAYRGLSSFKGESSFRTWITRIALNQCKDALRRRKRRRFLSLEQYLEEGLPASQPSQEAPEEMPELVLEVTEEMMESLNKGERAVIRLMREKGILGYADIAGELGLTVDGVKGKLKRARKKLRGFLKK
jgi:RNA polymerase sigma-70 factor (ECF subfamily)